MTERAETIFRELSAFEVIPGATLADAIAFYRSEKTAREARNDLAKLALNVADALDGESVGVREERAQADEVAVLAIRDNERLGDEIERLRACSERLEMALRYIMSDATDLDETHVIAKHALATLEQSMPAQVPGGPTCHPGALWEALSPITGVSLAVCSICKQPAKT